MPESSVSTVDDRTPEDKERWWRRGLRAISEGKLAVVFVGWWPGILGLTCYVVVHVTYYSMVENTHILCNLFFISIVDRGLGLAVLTLRDVSVSLSTQAIESYFCFLQLVL